MLPQHHEEEGLASKDLDIAAPMEAFWRWHGWLRDTGVADNSYSTHTDFWYLLYIQAILYNLQFAYYYCLFSSKWISMSSTHKEGIHSLKSLRADLSIHPRHGGILGQTCTPKNVLGNRRDGNGKSTRIAPSTPSSCPFLDPNPKPLS